MGVLVGGWGLTNGGCYRVSPPTSRRSKCTMTSVAPAQNGASMHIPTETPRVHCLTTPTHARRRAGHPLAGGRLGKQNAVRAILGRLVSSSRENMRILEVAVRQAYSLDSF